MKKPDGIQKSITPIRIDRAVEILGGIVPSRMALYQMVARRQVPFHKIGRRLIFIEEELREWLETQIRDS